MKYRILLSLLTAFFILSMTSCSSDDPTVPMDEMEEEMDDNNVDDNSGEGTTNDNLVDAPSFSMETTGGDKLESENFQGKNLVIWFFGAGCPPCRSIGPTVEKDIYQEFKDNDKFAMIGGDQWDQNSSNVDDFASVTGITFPLGKDASGVARDFGTTYDRFVIVNAEGKVVFKSQNRVSNHIDEAVKIIEDLLK